MQQHFLKSAAARTLSVKEVLRMTDAQATAQFRRLRWPDSNGKAVCPHCDCGRCYELRTRQLFKCSACRRQFSVTSGTLFHSAKLTYRDYLAIIAIFVNGVKGVSALQIARDIGISYKSAFVLLHKLREAIEAARSDIKLSGEVEIDGAYYGGYIRPPNAGREGLREIIRRRKICLLTITQRGGG